MADPRPKPNAELSSAEKKIIARGLVRGRREIQHIIWQKNNLDIDLELIVIPLRKRGKGVGI